MRIEPANLTEYLRRNLIHCKAVGAEVGVKAALKRLSKMQRPPKWLLTSLRGVLKRVSPLGNELAQHRNELITP